MIYRFFRKVHKLTAFMGITLLLIASSTSDLYVVELGQSEPEIVGRLITIGLMFLMPSAIYLLLDVCKGER